MLSYLAAALAAEGADVRVLTSALDVERLPLREEVGAPRGSLVVERLATSRVRFVGTLLHMNNLRRALARSRPDIAYVSMLKHDAFVTIRAGARMGFPVVLRPEGAGATGDMQWQEHARFGERIARRCKRAAAIIAISSAVRDELRTHGYDKDRIVDIPNGVRIPPALWNRRDGWRDAPVGVFVGRLAQEKNVETLLRAWALVRQSYPQAVLRLIGDGPERPSLEALAKSLGLTSAIQFIGEVEDVEARLRGADLFALPSKEEGMSIALLEAMALGMPIVASNIAGNRRLICDFKHGRLAHPEQPESLARAIIDQWSNLDRAIHQGRAARALVQQKYSIAAVAQSHLRLFARLLSERPRLAPPG